mmetsp:Transcript_16631/g.36885  ORF Transcript_16631/g.36885 Transcript_16631/m.36885 type:complete len:247 (+) Transcript_16631:70-810(+)
MHDLRVCHDDLAGHVVSCEAAVDVATLAGPSVPSFDVFCARWRGGEPDEPQPLHGEGMGGGEQAAAVRRQVLSADSGGHPPAARSAGRGPCRPHAAHPGQGRHGRGRSGHEARDVYEQAAQGVRHLHQDHGQVSAGVPGQVAHHPQGVRGPVRLHRAHAAERRASRWFHQDFIRRYGRPQANQRRCLGDPRDQQGHLPHPRGHLRGLREVQQRPDCGSEGGQVRPGDREGRRDPPRNPDPLSAHQE